MSNENRQVLTLKTEIEKYASPSSHQNKEATSDEFGHVKVDKNLNEQSHNPVRNSTIQNKINELENKQNEHENKNASNEQYGHVIIDKSLNEQSSNPVQNSVIYNEMIKIQTSISKMNELLGTNTGDIKKLLNLNEPTSFTDDINNLKNIGFYIYDNTEEQTIDKNAYYNKSLIFVLKDNYNIIQHIYSTKKKYTNDTFEYVLNGSQYIRLFDDNKWSKPTLLYKPYTNTTKTLIQEIQGKDTNIEIFENTNGYQIKWTQNNDDKSYEITSNKLYDYETICTFNNLNIDGPFIFGNLIGKCDIRITNNTMDIRSTLSKGNIIKNIKQTFFVPRI